MRITNWSLFLIPACTTTLNPTLGSIAEIGVIVLFVTFRTKTLSFDPAAPCVTVTVVVPSAPGIVAVILPAGSGGGAFVSRLLNVDVTADGSARPNGSLIPVVSVNV